MTGSRAWAVADRTGGPLDELLDLVRASFPTAAVSRLVGTWPADDDNVFWVAIDSMEVQIDMGARGSAPFVVEGEAPGSRLDTSDVDAAARQVRQLLARGRP